MSHIIGSIMNMSLVKSGNKSKPPLCFASSSSSLIHSLKEHDSRCPRLAPLPVFSSICPLHPCLPHLFLHVSHLDSILGHLFTASVFQSPVSSSFPPTSPSAPSITHSFLLTSPLLPSLCLSLHCFSSGSPLIKPLRLLPPCPVSTHTSHTSLSRFLSLFVLFPCFYHALV